MRIFLSLICFFAVTVSGCAPTEYTDQSLSSISITDRNGFSETISNIDRLEQYETVNFLSAQPYEKVLRVYHRDNEGNVRGELITYHPNGQPQEYLEILNGRAHGTYYSWHTNGMMHIQACIIEGEPDFTEAAEQTWTFDGTSYVWDDEGRLMAEIPYCKGVLEGESLYYHPSGNIWKQIHFHKNLEHGMRAIYLDSGELLTTTEFQNGVPHGKAYRYWNPDQLAFEETYNDGRLQQGTYYDQNGNVYCQVSYGEGYKAVFARDYIVEQQQYMGGLPEGAVHVYSPEGFLLQTYHTKDGLKYGEDIEYYPESQGTVPKISTQWIEGQLQGTVKTWYPSGAQQSQREMNHTQKDGVLMAWYEDGSLMMLEEYEKDNLVKGEYYRKDDTRPVSRVLKGTGTVTLFDSKGNMITKFKVKNGKPEL